MTQDMTQGAADDEYAAAYTRLSERLRTSLVELDRQSRALRRATSLNLVAVGICVGAAAANLVVIFARIAHG